MEDKLNAGIPTKEEIEQGKYNIVLRNFPYWWKSEFSDCLNSLSLKSGEYKYAHPDELQWNYKIIKIIMFPERRVIFMKQCKMDLQQIFHQ